MDYKVEWSRRALEDVEAIATYISRDSSIYAAAVVRKIRDTGRSLRRFPFIGRIVPELQDEAIRERFVYSYRIIYRIRGHTVTVAAVVHGSRLLERLLDAEPIPELSDE
jgi:toxin ParE1/3/4